MRILFIHRNFPGPFRQLALHFGSMPDTTVLFLSERGNKELRLPGVRRLRVSPAFSTETKDLVERQCLTVLRQASKTANSLLRLRKDGFVPDIVYGASADGYSFYVRDIFPDALFVIRADWFFTRGESHNFFNNGKPRPATDFAQARWRNLTQYNALGDCDLAVTASAWQKSQYPDCLADKIQILHEGIDTSFFSPAYGGRFLSEGCDLTGVRELVTFSCRHAGPARGFPQFAQCLPKLLETHPQCHVVMMVSSQCEPDQNGTCITGLDALRATISLEAAAHKRVHILEFKSVVEYRALLRASTAHVYLTAPSALSAGLHEAMACGALVVGSDTAPVGEVIRHGENGFLCDFWDSNALAATIAGVLDLSPRCMPIREAARNTIVQEYDQTTQIARHSQLILDANTRKSTTSLA